MKKVFDAIIAKKELAAKFGAGIGGASGILFIVFFLHSDLQLDIKSAEASSKEYADNKDDLIKQDLNHLKGGQFEIKEALQKIDDKLYRLKER